MFKQFAVAALALCLSTAAARADEVLVFAAASLTNALNEIGDSFTAQTGHSLKPSYAASSALAKQVEQGAPAHVFASADLKWMDYMVEKKLVNNDSRFNLLGNTLVLVAPIDAKQDRIALSPQTDIAGLAGSGRIATGNPDSVPVGLYFKQAMERSGQWGKVDAKIARADSVRAALAFVERGEAPLGVVYATDAAVSKKVKVVGVFPDTMHDPIVYPFALVAGKETAAAKALLDYLKGAQAKGVFVKYGFKVN
ncbi:molybdate ABC transporter substrate-binding protein [Magnetospirillum gryphiswaldense]|uniref:ABC-type molybdate transport system, periplasmic component n=1 Tax=Magnetospirillum gryphiswaldense TaxID=55518 RepID=A4TYH7_9PROT|nr:molybdate ABC transporter substrate-binding protein [Magnetospirillum gryphiswaldense]AVM75079.1 Molybdate-binding periplasmic protein precursor [Magnetospirillum gryphiswaldense MSR-1]AVM78982.1 Molybdate-binding periplasmic protein precursor [Magnetospirillum gryphiswaldense]CAM75684.1 ABC-type molybdate transport system, periplasmic component [Magnetospirillum gryphiswaldense MSR-1]